LTPPEFCGRPTVAGAGDRLFLRRGERSEERGEGGGEEEKRRRGEEETNLGQAFRGRAPTA
jgi:hypothetical protein